MDCLCLTGMLVKEAKEALSSEGILDYDIALTSPPRLSDRGYSDDSRVILVRQGDSNESGNPRLKVMVCNPKIMLSYSSN
ncbi:MAG TPA: hypothetical protein DIW17_00735 [Clostridiales bacterium]|nr:hypothetical protein [Clostridiales bacterium]